MRRLAPLSSFPLATRLPLARVAARFAVASVTLSLVMTIITPETMDYPFGLLLAVLAVPLVIQLLVAFAPLHKLPTRDAEWLLRLFTMSAVAAVYGTVLGRPMDNGLGFAFLGFALMLSSVTLRTSDTMLVLGGSSVSGLYIVAGMPTPSTSLFVLLPGLLIGAIAAYWAHLHSRSTAALDASRQAALSASSALGAVVAGARESIGGEPHEVLQAVVDATTLLGADTAAVYILDDDGMLAFGAQIGPLDDIAVGPVSPGTGLLGDALRTDETVWVRDYATYAEAVEGFVDAGLSSAMATPVKLPDGTTLGVMAIGQLTDGAGFSATSGDALELLAQHAARALRASREVHADRRTLRALGVLIERQRDFVATASHELRTPVTVIDGLADTLMRHGALLDDEQRTHLLARLAANSAMLRSIVESLLDTASLEQGLTLGQDVVDLAVMCTEATDRLGPLLVGHKVEVHVEADSWVQGDAGLLTRVIDNLITNAQRHTPAGTTVTITVRRQGRYVEAEVADNGPGIPAAVLPSITERFVRAGDHHTRSSRGLGIGLALVEQVLQLHGTRLAVSSTEGAGATFAFRLLHVQDTPHDAADPVAVAVSP